MNHSFVPSTSIRHLPLVPSVVALRALAEGDEIHFDYQSNELPMACPFECDGVVICGKNTTTTNTANEDGSCRKDKMEEVMQLQSSFSVEFPSQTDLAAECLSESRTCQYGT